MEGGNEPISHNSDRNPKKHINPTVSEPHSHSENITFTLMALAAIGAILINVFIQNHLLLIWTVFASTVLILLAIAIRWKTTPLWVAFYVLSISALICCIKWQKTVLNPSVKVPVGIIQSKTTTARIPNVSVKPKQVSNPKQVVKKYSSTTINNSNPEQRGWVAVTSFTPVEYKEGNKTVYMKAGEKINCEVIVTNIGKTPVQVTNTGSYIFHMKPNEKPPLPEEAIMSIQSQNTTLIPGAALEVGIRYSEKVYSADEINGIKNREQIVYVYGMIAYKDKFGKSHFTKYCSRLASNLSRFDICPFYNEAD